MQLNEAHVPIIEAGSACTSEYEREAIRCVADLGLDASPKRPEWVANASNHHIAVGKSSGN